MSLRFPFESSSKLLSRAPESPTPANATESLSTSKARLCSGRVAPNLPPRQGAPADVDSGPVPSRNVPDYVDSVVPIRQLSR